MTFDPTSIEITCATLLKDHVSNTHGNIQQCVDDYFLNLKKNKGQWPQMTFDPTFVEVTCVILPKYHCVQVPSKYIKVCGYIQRPKNLKQKVKVNTVSFWTKFRRDKNKAVPRTVPGCNFWWSTKAFGCQYFATYSLKQLFMTNKASKWSQLVMNHMNLWL